VCEPKLLSSLPLTKPIILSQGQLKGEVIYLLHGQVQILEFECRYTDKKNFLA
jgi:hypothetical protein